MENLDIRAAIRRHRFADEPADAARLMAQAALDLSERRAITDLGVALVRRIRQAGRGGMMERFLSEYGLSTKEGIALMCLAEALLRVPDEETIDALIEDKIVPAAWGKHLGQSSSPLVNASTWALLLTGRVLDDSEPGMAGVLRGVVKRLGEPVIRKAVAQSMRELGRQFVLAETIEGAIVEARTMESRGYGYSFDMLGEAARTDADARRYHLAYADAIAALGKSAAHDDVARNPGISVKLSALHPRYEEAQRQRVIDELLPRLEALATLAASANIGFNIDAEEADRLELSLDVVETLLAQNRFARWDGFGFVVQAYSPRAFFVIDWLNDLAERLDRRLMVRLVKGAYWDSEIKHAQIQGLKGFPVFTQKPLTDISYLACARRLLQCRNRLYPQFATHNAHSCLSILHMAKAERADLQTDFEFQRLHGMGADLHERLRIEHQCRCRIYAPVGAHRDLLAYLVRRLLENGANSSFVSQIADVDVPAEQVVADPFAADLHRAHHSALNLPTDIFGQRRNSAGFDLSDPDCVNAIDRHRDPFKVAVWERYGNAAQGHNIVAIKNPARTGETVGTIRTATIEDIEQAFALATQSSWASLSVDERALCLERAADAFEANWAEIFALLAREAGKTLPDAVGELREAVDFLRFYAMRSRELAKQSPALPLGIFVCISPWNFPLAIFTGQIAAALVEGSRVLAKPAEQTPLIAALAVDLLHGAGIAKDALILLPGDGISVGAKLCADPRVAGVCFTGSTETAQTINRQLAQSSPNAPLIAETGGLNAMIVDSSALLEQAVGDIVVSAFQSAGQRCSALRILYVQEDICEALLEMLFGAMDELRVGDPWDLATDLGPLIDADAHRKIAEYVSSAEADGRCLKRLAAPASGHFLGPAVIRVGGIEDLAEEIFGPVLHVATYGAQSLDAVIADINAKGFGLTMGVHSRIDNRVDDVVHHARVGNLYINRNQIGAVVGSQPFGGEGLSGTGFKAGGPNYLRRFRRSGGKRQGAVFPKASVGLTTLEAALAKARPVADIGALAERWSRHDLVASIWQRTHAVSRKPIDLPGPTGESNRLGLHPIGTVLCLGPEGEVAKAQALMALWAGNSVVIATPEDIGELPEGVEFVRGGIDVEDALAQVEPLNAVALSDCDRFAICRRALSNRSGPIVPLIATLDCPYAFFVERTVSIDTTAAGGNASLLAAVG